MTQKAVLDNKALENIDLSAYLPKAGGTLTGRIYGNSGNGLEIQSLNTGSWKEGIRIYNNATNDYSVLSLCDESCQNCLALVQNTKYKRHYIDIEEDGVWKTIDIPYKSGTMALIEELKDETVKNNMGFKWDLLWTNPNHYANFGAQTITLDLSSYNIICMKVKSAHATDRNYVTHLFFMYPDGDYYLIQSSYPSNWNVHKRRCKVNSNNIIFEDALYSSSSSDTGTIINHCCIPMTIYGIKLI